MKVCILDNDILEREVALTYTSYAAMLERLLRDAGAAWSFETFNTTQGHYPVSFDAFDAVLLTGSRADSFSQVPWVVQLRDHVTQLLQSKKKLVGVCFGHQLIAMCLGAPVGRAPQGRAGGRMRYQWHAPAWPQANGRTEIAMLASHQDQVFELPAGATLLASNEFCPVAAFALGQEVFCVQPHPEFVEDYSAYLLNKQRDQFDEARFAANLNSLTHGHDGAQVARMMIAFVEAR